jgi:lysophospholipase L1-like esterase
LALGDSLTEGIGASSPSRHFVAQYFVHLRQTEQCQLRNFGISGMTSGELLDLIAHPAVARLIPQVTHISITSGGCDFIDVYEKGKVTLRDILKTSKRLQENMRKILTLIREGNPLATLHVLGFYIPLPAYEFGSGQVAFLVQMFNRAYEKICSRFGATFVNPYESFLHRKDYFSDEVHPNQQGYDELAKLFVQSGKGNSKVSILH